MFHLSRVSCAVACVGLSCAIRRDGPTPITSSGVVSTVSSLIGEKQSPGLENMMSMIQALDQSSLDASNLNETIDTLRQTIQTTVVDVILQEHSNTQTELNEKLEVAKAKVSTARGSWEEAVDKFATYSTCAEAEKAKAEAWKESVDNVSHYMREHQATVDAIPATGISATLASMTITCDTSTTGNCAASVETLEGDVAKAVANVKSSVLAKQSAYDTAIANEATAKAHLDDAIAVRDARNSAHESQVDTCDTNKTTATTYFCSQAAPAEEAACDALAAFDSLEYSTKGTGNMYSVSDRAAEYDTIMKVDCFLRKLKDPAVQCQDTTYDIANEAEYVALDYKTDERGALSCKKDEARSVDTLSWTRPARENNEPGLDYASGDSLPKDLDGMKADKNC